MNTFYSQKDNIIATRNYLAYMLCRYCLKKRCRKFSFASSVTVLLSLLFTTLIIFLQIFYYHMQDLH